jgi:phosphonate metabolism protein (transferase hexapeptide repeat family)
MLLRIEPTVGEHVELVNTRLGKYTQIGRFSVLRNVTMGDYSYCDGFNEMDYATIGKFCSIATFARVNPGNHPAYTRVAQHHFTYRSSNFGLGPDDDTFFEWRKQHWVTIGNDVWIGHKATVMPGVTVGNGAAIGTGAVVTKDVEPYAVVAGVPAKKLKMRFDDALIVKIEKSRWWDWDHETLRARLEDFRNMDEFVRKYL